MATEAGGAARLEHLRGRIDHWRRTRTKHGPMPEALWDKAASLARGLGVCPVSRARALGIGYESLQERVADTPPAALARLASAGAVRFVESSGAQVGSPMGGTVVEIQSADGLRLTIRLSPGTCCGPGGGDRRPPGSVVIQITPQMRVLVAVEAVDFRRGIDGLGSRRCAAPRAAKIPSRAQWSCSAIGRAPR